MLTTGCANARVWILCRLGGGAGDTLSGLLLSAYALGEMAGPLLGANLGQAAGFGWASFAWGLCAAAECALVACCLLCRGRGRREEREAEAAGLQTPLLVAP